MESLANYIDKIPNLLALIPQCFNTSTQTQFVESTSAFLQLNKFAIILMSFSLIFLVLTALVQRHLVR
jgi:hypothetical protein